MLNYLICGQSLIHKPLSTSQLSSRSNNRAHKFMSPSNFSKGLSNKHVTRQYSKDKPPCPTTVLPLNVSEAYQTHSHDYNFMSFFHHFFAFQTDFI